PQAAPRPGSAAPRPGVTACRAPPPPGLTAPRASPLGAMRDPGAVQARVDAAVEVDELGVRALLDEVALVEHHDAVRVLGGGEAVGDGDGGAAAGEAVDRLLEAHVRRGVDGAGGLVEHDD